MGADPNFAGYMQQKYANQKQMADAETTKANAAAAGVAQQQGLQESANAAALARQGLMNQGAMDMENARVAGGLQERGLANQGATDVADITGNYGLQSHLAYANARVTAATSPEFGAMRDDMGNITPYAKNQAGLDYLQSQQQAKAPPALPNGMGSYATGAGAPGAGIGLGLNPNLLGNTGM